MKGWSKINTFKNLKVPVKISFGKIQVKASRRTNVNIFVQFVTCSLKVPPMEVAIFKDDSD